MLRLIQLPHRAQIRLGSETISPTGELNYTYVDGPIIECYIEPGKAVRVLPHGLGVEAAYNHVLWCYEEDISSLNRSLKWQVQDINSGRLFDVVGIYPLSMNIVQIHLMELAGG